MTRKAGHVLYKAKGALLAASTHLHAAFSPRCSGTSTRCQLVHRRLHGYQACQHQRACTAALPPAAPTAPPPPVVAFFPHLPHFPHVPLLLLLLLRLPPPSAALLGPLLGPPAAAALMRNVLEGGAQQAAAAQPAPQASGQLGHLGGRQGGGSKARAEMEHASPTVNCLWVKSAALQPQQPPLPPAHPESARTSSRRCRFDSGSSAAGGSGLASLRSFLCRRSFFSCVAEQRGGGEASAGE